MQKKIKTFYMLAFVLGGAAGVTMACHPLSPPECGTPGWNYGGANCGNVPPSTSTTRLQCKQCCQNAVNTGVLPADQLLDCRAFCDHAQFPNDSGDPEPGPR